MRSVVVLPAPFGPRKPVTDPGSTVKLRRSTARTEPRKILVSPSTTIRPRSDRSPGPAAAGEGAVDGALVIRPSHHIAR